MSYCHYQPVERAITSLINFIYNNVSYTHSHVEFVMNKKTKS